MSLYKAHHLCVTKPVNIDIVLPPLRATPPPPDTCHGARNGRMRRASVMASRGGHMRPMALCPCTGHWAESLKLGWCVDFGRLSSPVPGPKQPLIV